MAIEAMTRAEQPAPEAKWLKVDESQVLILAPTHDAVLTERMLTGAGFSCRRFGNADDLLATLTPHAGTLLIAEELLTPALMKGVRAALQVQPAWSDLPIILIANSSSQHLPLNAVTELGNVALLQRPMVPGALISAVASALRARRRQWEVRDLLRHQQEQASLKDQFLAMLAHELRNPLAPIRYASHLLRRPGLSEDKQTQLALLVDRQVGHMGRIIDQLLDVSRLTRGLIRLERKAVDMCALIQDALAAHAISAQAKEIMVSCDCCTAVFVDGDETRLRQVLDNLIDNAIKFSPNGTTVHVGLVTTDGKVRVNVTDQGDGIEKDLQPLLFDAFVQSDRSLERSRGGLGLGLSLVKGMIDLHGGKVWVHSDGPGSGSTFTVELPVKDVDEGSTRFRSTVGTLEHRRTVLIAEDNVDAADALQMILEAQGFHVDVVHSGPAAVEALARLRPDALVCDIGLPGLSGYDVARSANARHRPALMVAVTGYGSSEDRANSLAAGFDAHLSKPIEVTALVQMLASSASREGQTS